MIKDKNILEKFLLKNKKTSRRKEIQKKYKARYIKGKRSRQKLIGISHELLYADIQVGSA